jgi:ribosomal protein S18 acetylase RimI-like enzyme
MDEVVGELSREGVPGIHLGVDPGNTAAPGFYQRLGFRPVTGPPGARWYGILLA